MAKYFTNIIFWRWLSRSPSSWKLTFKKKKRLEVEAPRDLLRRRRSTSPRLRSGTTTRPPPYKPNAQVISRRRRRQEGEFQYSCDFPEEIIREILGRLPSVKSIIKCTAVCKSWRYVIKSPTFIAAHLSRRHQNRNDLYLLDRRFNGYVLYWDDAAGACASPPGGFRSDGGDGDGAYCSFSLVNNTNSMIITPVTYKSFTYSGLYVKAVGTCNGIICLANFDRPKILWNPSIRKFVTLPRFSITIPDHPEDGDYKDLVLPTCAFGYDSRNNDYKVLQIWSSKYAGGPAGDTPFGVEVYSLARGSWKPLPSSATTFPGCFLLSICSQPNVFFNGAVHWLLPRDRKSTEFVIVSFDMVTESFGEIKLPKKPGYPTYLNLSIHEEDGSPCLALIETESDCQPAGITYHLHLWVMQHYGVVDSWTKLYSVTLNNQQVTHLPTPFAFKSNGQQVFRSTVKGMAINDAQLLTVDFKTKQVQFIGQDGCVYGSMQSFVESLVLLDQTKAFSY